jgi:hypothetical protein
MNMSQTLPAAEHIAIMAQEWGVDYDIAEAFCAVNWNHRDLIAEMYAENIAADGRVEIVPELAAIDLVYGANDRIYLTEKGERYAVQMLGAVRTEAPRQMELFA